MHAYIHTLYSIKFLVIRGLLFVMVMFFPSVYIHMPGDVEPLKSFSVQTIVNRCCYSKCTRVLIVNLSNHRELYKHLLVLVAIPLNFVQREREREREGESLVSVLVYNTVEHL